MGIFGRGDWGIKALSLLLAVGLWMYVSSESAKEQEFKGIPVEIRGIGPNLAVSELPGSVSVRVQANQNVITSLTLRSIEVFVDLSSVRPGKTTAPVQVKTPVGVKAIDLRTKEVTIRLEPLAEKQVPLKARSAAAPADGFKVLDIKTRPEAVILRGPKSILDRVAFATADVDLKDRNDSFGESAPVRVSDDLGNFLEERLVKRSPSVVDVLVTIVPDLPSRTVRVIPRVTGAPGGGYSVIATAVEPGELIITGDRSLLNGISEVYTRPVNINGARNDVYTDIGLELPQGITANRQLVSIMVKIGQDQV